MWLTEELIKTRQNISMTTGVVTSSEEAPTVQAEIEYRAPNFLMPYGIKSLPIAGEKTVIIEGICANVQEDADGLAPGEVRLRSAGGAEIWLKNNGDVVVNGQVFATEKTKNNDN